MSKIFEHISALSLRQRIMLIGSIGAFVVVFGVIMRIALTPSMALLYAGLEPSAAGDIIAVLEQRGTPYEVRSGSIFVSQTDRDQLRMTLAGEGLPQDTIKGYELLDNLSGFSTTSQMFDATYWRAKEGELARTIAANPNIKSARVHISNASSSIFDRSSSGKAAVTVSTVNDGISAKMAKSLRYLVASAVQGLAPKDVAVIDAKTGLVADIDNKSISTAHDEKAHELQAKVQRLLEAQLGLGNAVVEVSVEADMDQESITEQFFDPKGRVAISTQTVESENANKNSGSIAVGVASNVPNEQSVGDSGGGSSSASETREITNYEVSQTQRQIVRAPGSIERISVAVLVNESVISSIEGQNIETVLGNFSELVSTAVGADQARGDVVTIKAMRFPERPLGTEPLEPPLFEFGPIDTMQIIQLSAFTLTALILAVFVLKPLLQPNFSASKLGENAIEGQVVSTALSAQIGEGAQMPITHSSSHSDGAVAQSISGDLVNIAADPPPVERLRALIGEKQDETVEILRSWLEEESLKS